MVAEILAPTSVSHPPDALASLKQSPERQNDISEERQGRQRKIAWWARRRLGSNTLPAAQLTTNRKIDPLYLQLKPSAASPLVGLQPVITIFSRLKPQPAQTPAICASTRKRPAHAAAPYYNSCHHLQRAPLRLNRLKRLDSTPRLSFLDIRLGIHFSAWYLICLSSSDWLCVLPIQLVYLHRTRIRILEPDYLDNDLG